MALQTPCSCVPIKLHPQQAPNAILVYRLSRYHQLLPLHCSAIICNTWSLQSIRCPLPTSSQRSLPSGYHCAHTCL